MVKVRKARGRVREHHGIHEADARGEPGGAQVRERVHDARAHEEHADRGLGRAELRVEKICEERAALEAAGEAVQREQEDIFVRMERLCGLTSARRAAVGDSACDDRPR